LADQWEKLAKLAGQKYLTEAQCRKVIAEMYEEAIGQPLHFQTTRDYFDEWLKGVEARVDDRTYERYEQVITSFVDHLGAKSDQLIRHVTSRDIISWRDSLSAKGLAASSVNNAVRVLRMPLRAGHETGKLELNPCAVSAVPLVADDDEDVSENDDVFTPSMVAKLLKAAPSEDWRGAILLGFYSGLRLQDVANLEWGNIDMEKHIITVIPRKTRRHRTRIVVPIHMQLYGWLKKQKIRGLGRVPVFRSLCGCAIGGGCGLSSQFLAIRNKAGITGRLLRESGGDGGRSRQTLTFHSFRHGIVSALANAGVATELRQAIVGHSDSKTHEIYTHRGVETLRAAIGLLPRVSGK
jgi:integrase